MRHPLLEVPGPVISQLKDALRMGMVMAPYSMASVRSVDRKHADGIKAGLDQLADAGICDRGVVEWLDAVDAARSEVARPSLVWTGPEVVGLHARDTQQVFRELIGRAEESLWISTYTYYEGSKAFADLVERMEAYPNLRVRLMLNVPRKDEKHASAEEALAKASRSLWKYNWKGTRRPEVYYFPESIRDDPAERAVLHAKAIVRDEEEVLVTSANFTEKALKENIELGVLLHDRYLAQQTVSHYERLIEEGRLVALPDERC